MYGELIKKGNDTHSTDTSDLFKKLTMTQKLLIMIIAVSILLLKNLIS